MTFLAAGCNTVLPVYRLMERESSTVKLRDLVIRTLLARQNQIGFLLYMAYLFRSSGEASSLGKLALLAKPLGLLCARVHIYVDVGVALIVQQPITDSFNHGSASPDRLRGRVDQEYRPRNDRNSFLSTDSLRFFGGYNSLAELGIPV